MADGPDDRAQRLREEYLGQTARIPWRELQTHYAAGSVVCIGSELNLVEVAVQLGLDNTTQFKAWIDRGEVTPVSDAQALQWFKADQELWAVVAAPWVLVQDRPDGYPVG